MQLKSTERFSDRAAFYVRARPTYPTAIIAFLTTEFGLTSDKLVADVGSGAGLLTKLFLDHGNRVFGVEPNPEMRAEGEKFLAGYPGFVSVNGTAEATTLADASVDAVVAGQALHWFDPSAARREFGRICKPDGLCAVVMNKRDCKAGTFDAEYDAIVKEFTVDPHLAHHTRHSPETIAPLFTSPIQTRYFDNPLSIDRQGLMDRLLSSSNMPIAGPARDAMLRRAGEAFDRFAENGRVLTEYTTRVYCGKLH